MIPRDAGNRILRTASASKMKSASGLSKTAEHGVMTFSAEEKQNTA